MNFGIKLKNLRIKENLTQKQLAELSNIGTSTINNYEKGNFKPTYEKLIKLSDALQVPTIDLISETELEKIFPFIVEKHNNYDFKSDKSNHILYGAFSDYDLKRFPVDEESLPEEQILRLMKNISNECIKMNPKGIFKVLEYAKDISENSKYKKK